MMQINFVVKFRRYEAQLQLTLAILCLVKLCACLPLDTNIGDRPSSLFESSFSAENSEQATNAADVDVLKLSKLMQNN